MTELIYQALNLGAAVFGSVSGGKDGQAMVRTLIRNQVLLAGMIHCDLGRSEWPQSMGMCQRLAAEYDLPLHILRRSDGLDLVAYMQRRMQKLAGTGKPFWPSSTARYCTSDLKRGPSDAFFRHCGHNLIISAEGIRAAESKARAKKQPLSIRQGVTSKYYGEYYTRADGKKRFRYFPVEKALAMYSPRHRLVLNWYPIFNMTTEEVWATYNVSLHLLQIAREHYRQVGQIPEWWPFHPAYVMGNERVSCLLCILGCMGDLENGAREDPSLLEIMIAMEDDGGATFRDGFSLKQLRAS